MSIGRDLLSCDERCSCNAPGGQCYDLTIDSPAGPRLVAVVHWRVVPFIRRADTGELLQVPDDGSLPFAVTLDDRFPLLAEVR